MIVSRNVFGKTCNLLYPWCIDHVIRRWQPCSQPTLPNLWKTAFNKGGSKQDGVGTYYAYKHWRSHANCWLYTVRGWKTSNFLLVCWERRGGKTAGHCINKKNPSLSAHQHFFFLLVSVTFFLLSGATSRTSATSLIITCKAFIFLLLYVYFYFSGSSSVHDLACLLFARPWAHDHDHGT